jgi:hypothetical protein
MIMTFPPFICLCCEAHATQCTACVWRCLWRKYKKKTKSKIKITSLSRLQNTLSGAMDAFQSLTAFAASWSMQPNLFTEDFFSIYNIYS